PALHHAPPSFPTRRSSDLRNLATFTPEQRRRATSATGLAFTQMSLAQQQRFLALAGLSDPVSLQELQGAALRVDYSEPGEFQWGDRKSTRLNSSHGSISYA